MNGIKMKLKLKILSGLLVVIIVLFFIFTGRSSSEDFVQISEYNPVLGQNNAPVTVAIFGDSMCGYTRKFFEEVFPQLKESYIDTGKVKFVYKQFPPSDESKIEAEALLCAHDQGKFWSFISLFFEKRGEWEQEDNATFNKYTSELRLDKDIFLNCLNQHLHRTHVEEDYNEGIKLDVSKTPTFFINGMMIVGMNSFEDFEDILSKFTYN